ncbi:protein phosphatase 1 regulatory subunit 15A-like [Scleropages formosus]|uniref:Protein DP71L n=1 Tax=Scleropages formosus TaxID=113540 RepID=A0A8C9QU81_SCLFO|nr:protein phosphatase 1 regulatory subunit 15A-like [Scleropages formosus]XP_018593384.2 protein phosphatase 1 regulatory subunit 15A-like [Scleropages formosus]
MWYLGFVAIIMLKIRPPRKKLELYWMRVLQELCKALQYLWASLFGVPDSCRVPVMRPQAIVFPPGAMVDVASLTFGVLDEKMGKHLEEQKGSTFQGVMWTPGRQEADLAWAPDEEILEEEEEDPVVAADMKFLEADCLREPVTGELEVTLADWLEWDTNEEIPEEFCHEVCLEAIPKPPLSHFEITSVCSPTTVSTDGEMEWDSDSSWDDDDDDDDDDTNENLERNSELWESFMRNDDPYNPFKCSSVTAVNERHVKRTESCTQRPLQMNGRREDVCDTESSPPEDEKMTVSSRKVRFSNVVKVHPLVTWSFASRAARDGSCWQEIARDRARFKRRVDAVNEIISPCLLPEHRAMVWERVQLL